MVLGPVLFKNFTNDLDNEVECTLSKFVDDLKKKNGCVSPEGHVAIQRELDSWRGGLTNFMKFNKEKCGVLYLGEE